MRILLGYARLVYGFGDYLLNRRGIRCRDPRASRLTSRSPACITAPRARPVSGLIFLCLTLGGNSRCTVNTSPGSSELAQGCGTGLALKKRIKNAADEF